jgi:uncharacterized membrane protein
MEFIARASGLRLPWTDVAAMFTAVWMLYVADRMMDGRVLERDPQASGLESRHLFHHLYRETFRWGLVAGLILLLYLLPHMLRPELISYVSLGMILAGWFGLIHQGRQALPKEIAVGIFFALAVTLPSALRLGHAWVELAVPALFLALVCSLNCLFICAWETENGSSAENHITAQLALRFLPQLTLFVAGAELLMIPLVGPSARWILGASALATALLIVLHLLRHRFTATTLRALADVALLTPALLLPAEFLPHLSRMWVR